MIRKGGKMQRGNLIVYDLSGKIWSQTGEAEGDLLPHVYPVGVPYIELPFGAMKNKIALRVEVNDPTGHYVVFEEIPVPPSTEELIQQALDAYTQELIDGGLL